MKLLDRKCVIAATGMHGLLALVLIFCSAFLVPSARVSDEPLITIDPGLIPDDLPARPQQPPGNPPPASRPDPRPQSLKPLAPPITDPGTPKPAKAPPGSTPVVNVRHPILRPVPGAATTATPTADSQDRGQQDWRRNAAGRLDQIIGDLNSTSGKPTAVPNGFTSGDTGSGIGSYSSLVRLVYQEAWITPEDASSDDATVQVRVTIARDGSVVVSRITQRSGDAAVDASVQRALDRVTTIGRPFPEAAPDNQRTYTIPFNLRTKRGTA